MKYRKIMGGRIKGPSERGAWAELYFMVLAMTYGLKVSSPYGGFGPCDVGVENGAGPILKAQVKCTSYQWRGHFVTNICVTAVRGVDACQPTAKGPIDIHASCDEEAETRVAREEIERAAVRRMFRGVLQS
jgi:hypothetical protein